MQQPAKLSALSLGILRKRLDAIEHFTGFGEYADQRPPE
jgi:hypothetical protein